MRVLSTRSCAQRITLLLFLVCAIDVAAAFLSPKPLPWCAFIPGLIPIFTPAAIFSRRAQSRI